VALPAAKTFEELIVWQKAHAFVLGLYELTAQYPREELYGLTSQARKAAVSKPANIAEGFKRRGRIEKARFLNISQGSAEEVRYYLRLGRDLGYGSNDRLLTLLDEVTKLLEAYRSSVVRSFPSIVRPVVCAVLSVLHLLDSRF
jgi:four helix bundle protein